MLLETNDIAPGQDPKADHLQRDSPGGGSVPGRQKFPEQASPPGAFPLAVAEVAPPPPQAPLGCLCWGRPGNPGETRGYSCRDPHSEGEIPSPWPRSLAPPTADPAAQPRLVGRAARSCRGLGRPPAPPPRRAEPVAQDAQREPWPWRSAPGRGRPATDRQRPLLDEGAGVPFGGQGAIQRREDDAGPGGEGTSGGAGGPEVPGRPGERRRRSGDPGALGIGARGAHSPEISAWGTSLRLKPLAP